MVIRNDGLSGLAVIYFFALNPLMEDSFGNYGEKRNIILLPLKNGFLRFFF
jgi:hypothetical protein